MKEMLNNFTLIYHSGNEVQLYAAHFDNIYRKFAWNTYFNNFKPSNGRIIF